MDTTTAAGFMNAALKEAEKGRAVGEVPIGAVVILEGKVLGTGFNQREKGSDATAHAEILAIRQACEALGDWRLAGGTLVVTLEPCLMCYGAACQSRLEQIFYGCENPKNPAALRQIYQTWPHGPSMHGGVLAEQSAALLHQFFVELRGEAPKQ